MLTTLDEPPDISFVVIFLSLIFLALSNFLALFIILNTAPPGSPYSIRTLSTDKVDTRARARLAAVKIENDSKDESWRFGQFRFDIQPDGRR